jgi:hypothetical protein
VDDARNTTDPDARARGSNAAHGWRDLAQLYKNGQAGENGKHLGWLIDCFLDDLLLRLDLTHSNWFRSRFGIF